MTTRPAYSEDDWTALIQAPKVIALAVIAASATQPVQAQHELNALDQALLNARQSSGSPLIAAVANDPRANVTGDDPLNRTGGWPVDFPRAMVGAINSCQQVSSLLGGRAIAEETKAYKHWLLQIGREVAKAEKEGGLFGLGGKPISDDEMAVLRVLALVLGVEL